MSAKKSKKSKKLANGAILSNTDSMEIHQNMESAPTTNGSQNGGQRNQVHNCSFFDFIPSAIWTLAYSPANNGMMAVGRQNGDIEIWCTDDDGSLGAWFCSKVIRGAYPATVKALVWAGDRLFGGVFNATIVEYDLNRLTEKHIQDSHGGAVWGLAVSPDKHTIAAACDDGCVRLFDISDDVLSYKKTFHKVDERLLSIAWHSGGADIYTGGSTGFVRRWDTRSGSNLNFAKLKKRNTAVWSLAVTKDFSVVAGDSTGQTHFIDGKTLVVEQSFQEHNGDVLAVAVHDDCAFATGLDTKLELYKREDATGRNSWVASFNKRVHTHDVRALAFTKKMVVTAGNDCRLVYAPRDNFEEPAMKLSYLPFYPIVSTSRDSATRLVLFSHDKALELWRLGRGDEGNQVSSIPLVGENVALIEHPVHLLDLKPKVAGNIVCSAVSPNGVYVVCSDRNKVKLYELTYADNNKISVQPIALPAYLKPAHRLTFTNDSTRLVVATFDFTVQVFNLHERTVEAEHLEHQQSNTDKNIYPATIVALSISADDKWVASANASGVVHIHDLKTHKYHSTMPKLETQPVSMSFSGDRLAVLCASNVFYLYNLKQKGFDQWQRDNTDFFNSAYQANKHRYYNIQFYPHLKDHLLLVSQAQICVVNLAKKILSTLPFPHGAALWAEFLSDGDLVVTHRPITDVLPRLPAPLYRIRYRT